uniref:hypothetical protein orf482 n=1 Tax=Symphyocladia marchantioides TaxID=88360 RepID=UPI0022FD5986|nr:hypothetical protein orf482 [Symphyocladia marchantioides]WAX03839.1 hypothetical protein orf482 [Symphyocladia marchantioides]
MILFNFILFYKLGQNYVENSQFCHPQFEKESRNITNKYVNKHLKLDKLNVNNVLISKTYSTTQEIYPSLFRKEIKNNKLLSRNVWQKLINRYLQETIFLSTANTLSNSYFVKLKASGLSVYDSAGYKEFLYKFGKELLDGKVSVAINDLDSLNNFIPVYKNNPYLKYKWFKLLNLKHWTFNKHLFSTFISKTAKLSNFSLPLFVIINNNKEIVVSESTDQLSRPRVQFNILSYLIKSNKHNKNLYTCLLFINPQDAIEYRDYIKANFSSLTLSNNIQVVPANIQLYYKFMNLKNNNIDFRLIPDLTEISNLLNQYKKYKNVSFHINQKHSRKSFQGQPIYLIEPLSVRKRLFKNIKKLDYSYIVEEDKVNLKYKPAFLNYKTLIGAWKKYKKDNFDYDLPYVPKVSVLNFEFFIQEENYKKNYRNIIFLPSLQTYKFIQNHPNASLKNQQELKYLLLNKSLYLKTLVCRVFWSLTSRQPINW